MRLLFFESSAFLELYDVLDNAGVVRIDSN